MGNYMVYEFVYGTLTPCKFVDSYQEGIDFINARMIEDEMPCTCTDNNPENTIYSANENDQVGYLLNKLIVPHKLAMVS
ncbi:MAG: hypothetical protein AABY32_01865 [Nanoarchaeota archaeon]